MKQTNIGIAVIGAGRIGTLRARLAAKHPAVRFLAISDRDPARARAGRADRRRRPFRRQRRDHQRPEVTAVIVSTPERARSRPHGARARQAGAGGEADRPVAARRRHDPRDAARDQGRSAHRLQPPLQGMLPARQGADAARAGSAASSAAPRASTTRARRPSRSSSAIRTRRRWSTCSPITST